MINKILNSALFRKAILPAFIPLLIYSCNGENANELQKDIYQETTQEESITKDSRNQDILGIQDILSTDKYRYEDISEMIVDSYNQHKDTYPDKKIKDIPNLEEIAGSTFDSYDVLADETVQKEETYLPTCLDNDNDGHGTDCVLGEDCDDSNSSVYQLINCNYDGNSCGDYQLCLEDCPVPPEEVCDGSDNNCDGIVDEPGICDDNKACTEDICDSQSGCSYVFDYSLCPSCPAEVLEWYPDIFSSDSETNQLTLEEITLFEAAYGLPGFNVKLNPDTNTPINIYQFNYPLSLSESDLLQETIDKQVKQLLSDYPNMFRLDGENLHLHQFDSDAGMYPNVLFTFHISYIQPSFQDIPYLYPGGGWLNFFGKVFEDYESYLSWYNGSYYPEENVQIPDCVNITEDEAKEAIYGAESIDCNSEETFPVCCFGPEDSYKFLDAGIYPVKNQSGSGLEMRFAYMFEVNDDYYAVVDAIQGNLLEIFSNLVCSDF